MFESKKATKKEEEVHEASVIKGQLRAIGVAGQIKHRSKKKKKKKQSKFERRYTALGPLLKPENKRIDFVLVHKKKTSDDIQEEEKKESYKRRESMRRRFEEALQDEGFKIKSVEYEDLIYKTLHCPFKRLCKEAETVKLEMPLKGCEKYPPPKTTWITSFVEKHFETDDELDYISAPFKMNKIDLFEGYDNPTYFFRPSLRSFLTYHILINLDIRNRAEKSTKLAPKQGNGLEKSETNNKVTLSKKDIVQLQVVEDFIMDLCSCCPSLFSKAGDDKEDYTLSKMGLPYLLMKEVYTDAFSLHEDSELSKKEEVPNNKEATPIENLDPTEPRTHDPRKELQTLWTKGWKFQPLWKIRNYFGEKIALYFAWAGMLITTLWLPVFFGLACFCYGLTVSIERAEDNPEMPGNLSGREAIKWQMGELYDTLRGSFDNNVTPFFALVICLWGTVFLEFWKRHNAFLAYEWDVDQFEQNQPDRPEFFGTKVKKDPVTQDDNWYYPFKRQLIKFFLSTSALIFMICIVFISLAAVVVYRVIISVDYCANMSAAECLLTTNVISALLNAVSILILGRVYDWVALKLTEWENHRTQTQYDDALIIKLFAFQFANSYASCFYIAFFRGRFDSLGVFGLGSEYNDNCEGGNCMSQLSFQVFILMLAKPFPKFFKDIILPFLKRLWRNRPACCRNICCKNQVGDEEKEMMKREEDTETLRSKTFIHKEHMKPELGDFTLGEYTEKIIMYGFLMLFAASFPLAPLIAIVWLFIDKHIDAKRLLWFNRRPVAVIAQDIGMWYGILNFVNLVGVVSNGFLIAFTSSWGVKYSFTTRLWICIGFEHIVFAIKFILAYLIPDVPKDVRLAVRREKYQIAKKFEDKSRPMDYTELIPAATYDEKAVENSNNYTDFPLEEIDEDDDAGAPDLPALVEEDEIANHQSESVYADSHGVLSLRAVDPEGSRLFNKTSSTEELNPIESKDGSETKKSPKRNAGPLMSPPRSKKQVAKVTEEDENEESAEIPGSPKEKLSSYETVDPYSVVREVDVQRHDSETKC